MVVLYRNEHGTRCSGARTWTARRFIHFQGVPPVLILCPTYVDSKSGKLMTTALSEELFVGNSTYMAYAFTAHTGSDHFVSAIRIGNEWAWYDGLKQRLHYVDRVVIPKKYKLESAVYILN